MSEQDIRPWEMIEQAIEAGDAEQVLRRVEMVPSGELGWVMSHLDLDGHRYVRLLLRSRVRHADARADRRLSPSPEPLRPSCFEPTGRLRCARPLQRHGICHGMAWLAMGCSDRLPARSIASGVAQG
jgi:hypothetical protein